MGLSLSVTCAAEALVFYFLPQILSAIGIRRCMHLVFAAFLLRMGCYTALRWAPSPWLVLPAELLHGCTFALAWGGGTAYCAELSPPGLEATTQGLFQGASEGRTVHCSPSTCLAVQVCCSPCPPLAPQLPQPPQASTLA